MPEAEGVHVSPATPVGSRGTILVFRYGNGPDVAVAVTPDCQLGITNGRRLANNSHDVVAAINRLIKFR
jgi:hypothetical protein